uniref:Uncharacterized protein MANES_13G124000 n=1 Tax=Rhizophora mucronata TaxID=61149 RepID=A0A2P2J7E5_RHIMU
MKQNLVSSQSLDSLPSPVPGNYQDKGWSSERVPQPCGGRSRRHISALRPFYSGRALPSKWEDAERWICSPVLGYGVTNNCQSLPQRRPKSKSGPIPPPGITYYSNCSPSIQVLDGMSIQNLATNSPFSTGVLMPNGVAVHYSGGDSSRQANVVNSLPVPGWTDLISETSLPSSQGMKFLPFWSF